MLVDQDRVRWPGSGSAVSGSTPFGIYDLDIEFQAEAQSAAVWAAIRLGYPIVDIEMIDKNFYACFEEACNEYSSQVNQFNIRNNISTMIGQPISSVGNLSGQPMVGSPIAYLVELSKGYGTEVGVGGYVDWKRGHITTTAYQQVYDLQQMWGDVSESFQRIEIMRIFNDRSPAFARIYDPFSMTGMSYSNILNEMGFGAYSPAVQFLMTPIFEDLLRGQAIEFNDMVRKSQYSFELVNNKMKVFPIPQSSFNIYFDYIVRNDRYSGSLKSDNHPCLGNGSGGFISDYSNIPYNNITYATINDVGKQWIRTYFLALCKELLGCIRQKYQTIPIPGGETTLDGAELRNEAQQEKEKLITQIRETLEASGRRAQMEDRAHEQEYLMQSLRGVPLFIYIG